MSHYNTKCTISLVYELKPLINVIRAIVVLCVTLWRSPWGNSLVWVSLRLPEIEVTQGKDE